LTYVRDLAVASRVADLASVRVAAGVVDADVELVKARLQVVEQLRLTSREACAVWLLAVVPLSKSSKNSYLDAGGSLLLHLTGDGGLGSVGCTLTVLVGGSDVRHDV
jgi:hypothetical protein